MSCCRCNSNRIASVSAKCSDLCSISINGQMKDGYVRSDMGIGGGDYVKFKWCLECGQIQGQFTLKPSNLEIDRDEDGDDLTPNDYY